jgi:hypothetical protein
VITDIGLAYTGEATEKIITIFCRKAQNLFLANEAPKRRVLRVSLTSINHNDGKKLKDWCAGRQLTDAELRKMPTISKLILPFLAQALANHARSAAERCRRAFSRVTHSFGSFPDVLPEAMYDWARRTESNPRPVHEMSAPRPLASKISAQSAP